MSDRLAELRRQRALILEHLAWLDREIEAASAEKSPALSSPAAPDSTPEVATALVAAALKAKTSAPAEEPPAVTAAAESILEEYRVPPTALQTDIRKGCFLYFAAALLAVALIVTILYFALSHN